MVALNDKLPGTLMAAVRYFTADVAESYVRSIKWADGPCCPKCGSVNVGTIASRAKYQCRERGCRRQFSVIHGTIMESSHLPLEQWVVGVWMIVNCKNGVSSCEIARTLGIKQQSAWHLLHRVRHILRDDRESPLCGVVEADATYIGGALKFMHADRRERALASGRPKGKAIVHAMLERQTGRVRAGVVEDTTKATLRADIEGNVAEGTTLYTDASSSYDWTQFSWFNHQTVNHAVRYVDGECHTNGLEGFFNCLRRGLKGTYIAAAPEHLGAYVDEQVFRFNNRKVTDWERFELAMRRIVGQRLTYAALTDGAVR